MPLLNYRKGIFCKRVGGETVMYGIVVEPGKNSRVIIEKVSDLKLKELYRLTDCDSIAIGSIDTALLKKVEGKLGLVYDEPLIAEQIKSQNTDMINLDELSITMETTKEINLEELSIDVREQMFVKNIVEISNQLDEQDFDGPKGPWDD